MKACHFSQQPSLLLFSQYRFGDVTLIANTAG